MNASPGLWLLAWLRFCHDRVGVASLAVVTFFVALMIASGTGLVAGDWANETGVSHAPPTFVGPDVAPAEPAAAPDSGQAPSTSPGKDESATVDPLADELADIKGRQRSVTAASAKEPTLVFGGDRWGRDVLKKTIKGTQTSLFVGLVAAALTAVLGTVFGALAGYYGRWVDDIFNWFYSIFTSIPYLLLILSIAAVLNQKGTLTVILILGFTGWTGIFRLVRAEYLKHKTREYVQAADAIGASNLRRMFVHILPNVSHVVLVQLSLHVVLFIKSEVVLSFLGFGVGVDTVSWGSMLNEAQNELVLGKWWQCAAATAAMALLVTSFSLFTDALRDALDPRLK
jgi:peptide/nickel transport system permease protein